MLERTLDIDTSPGTNVAGNFPETNWVFLLPTLQAGPSRVPGRPTHTDTHCAPQPRWARSGHRTSADAAANGTLCRRGRHRRQPLPVAAVRAGSADLVVVTGQLSPRQRREGTT